MVELQNSEYIKLYDWQAMKFDPAAVVNSNTRS